MILFGPWNGSDALDVVLGMREADRREVYATRPGEDPWALFADLVHAQPGMLVCEIVYSVQPMMPVALFGVARRSPGVGSAFMLATPQLRPMMARAVARRVRDVVIPRCLDAGLHRADCESWIDHKAAHAFLGWTGARQGAVRPGVGRRGETFVEFAWLAPGIATERAA